MNSRLVVTRRGAERGRWDLTALPTPVGRAGDRALSIADLAGCAPKNRV